MLDQFTRETAAKIAANRGITQEQAEAITEAARPLWEAMEIPGFVDGFGGSEFDRIFPDVIEAIHRLANPLAHGEPMIIGTEEENRRGLGKLGSLGL